MELNKALDRMERKFVYSVYERLLQTQKSIQFFSFDSQPIGKLTPPTPL